MDLKLVNVYKMVSLIIVNPADFVKQFEMKVFLIDLKVKIIIYSILLNRKTDLVHRLYTTVFE